MSGIGGRRKSGGRGRTGVVCGSGGGVESGGGGDRGTVSGDGGGGVGW